MLGALDTDEIQKYEQMALDMNYTHAVRFLMTLSCYSLFSTTLWALDLANKNPHSRLAKTVLEMNTSEGI
jgi:hypothetical protein